MYNEVAVEHEVSTAIAYAMLSIDKEGTLSTQLGPKMGMEPRSLTRTLKSMEDKGLIKRVTETKDKRKVRIFLTEKGKIKRKIASNTVKAFNLKVIEGVDPEKLNHFYEVIDHINEIIADAKIREK
jgi:DNA-binding MarR family transcriptional regulator